MRGTHYGADYRWFTRFIGDDVNIPQVEVSREDVDRLLAERGISNNPGPVGIDAEDHVEASRPDLGRLTGAEDHLYPAVSAEPADVDEHDEAAGQYPPGSLKAAIARSRALAHQLRAARRPEAPEIDSRESSSAAGGPVVLTPEAQRIARKIQDTINPRELAQYSFEQLLMAFRAGGLSPGAGAKLVQAWAYGRQLSPEQVVAAMKRAKDEWLAQAERRPGLPAQLLPQAKEWDYDRSVADVLNQRANVGQGPKDIDRERLTLLRRLMASFSGQANYGFTGADAVVEAAASTDVLG